MMFGLGENYLITRLDELFAPTLGDQIDLFCCPGCENDLADRCGVDKTGRDLSGVFVGVGGPLAQFMHCPMNVGVKPGIVFTQGVDDIIGLLARGRAVKINQVMTVNFLIEGRKFRSYFLRIECGHRSLIWDCGFQISDQP